MTNKELLERFKDLEYVYENDKKGWLDGIKAPPLWIYADTISLGYEINSPTDKARQSNRKIGEPTAYALAIEARFCKDLIIKPVEDDKTCEIEYKPTKIDNKIQSFVYRGDDDKDATQQKIIVATTKEQQDKDPYKTYTISQRTKNFVNGYELVYNE